VGVTNFPIILDHVEDIIVVSDEEIAQATRLLWERMKLVVEPSGAVAFAAARSASFAKYQFEGPIGVILSGGNVDLDKPLPWQQQKQN
jgi:threonine dehydratase